MDVGLASSRTRSRDWPTLGVAFLLAAGALALYLPTRHFAFINLDDPQYVVDNAYVLNPSWNHLLAFFQEIRRPSTVAGYYQPLTMASLMLDRVLADNPDGVPSATVFHVTNVILHAANVVLLFVWLRGLTGSALGAAVAAAVFAAHPLHVESVAWINQRKTLLAAMFALLHLVAYHRYVRRPGALAMIWTCAAFTLSLLAKPTTTALPLALLLLDGWPYRRWSRAAVIEKLPLVLIAALFAVVAYLSQSESAGLAQTVAVWQPLATILTGCYAVYFYLSRTVWPANLCPQYPMPPLDQIRITSADFALGVATVAGLVVGLSLLRRHRVVIMSLAGFLLLLGPVLGAVRFMGAIVADRFAYLPMAWLLILPAVLIGRAGASTGRRAAIAAAAALAVAALARHTSAQQGVWRDSLTYWGAVVERFPNEGPAHEGLGSAFLTVDNLDAAMAEFEKARELQPTYARAWFRIGEVLLMRGRPQDAITVLTRGIELGSPEPDGHYLLGQAYLDVGRPAEAVLPLLEAVERKPSWRAAVLQTGLAMLRAGHAARSLQYFARYQELDPDNPDCLRNWAIALTECNQDALAFEILRRSLALRRNDAIAMYALAACAASLQNLDAAWEALVRALAMDPALMQRAETERRFDRMRAMPRWGEMKKAIEGLRSGSATQPSPAP